MRRSGVALTGVILTLIVVAACARQPEQQTLRRDKVRRDSIDETVSATGTVGPQARVNLAFRQAGLVSDVYVEVGSTVKEGEPLARINGDALDLAVRQAELALEAQQLSYDRLVAPPSKAALAGAQAAVAGAVAGYNKLKAPPDPEELQIAQYQYDQAYSAYLKADSELRAVQWYAPPAIVDQYRAALGIAINNLEMARLRLEQLGAPPDKNMLAAASASIAQAQAQLDGLKAGPTELEAARAQIQIAQAQLALDRARQQRDEATLNAPFSGVVTTVNVTPGALAPTALPAVVMIDNSSLHVDVNIDEVDISKVALGQSVVVELDALPSKSLSGQVTKIASSATNNAGVVTYAVRVDLSPFDLPVRSGMTATANIIVQSLVNVLVVPNWAIRFDRNTGQAYVSVLNKDGKLQDVPVVLGLRSSTESQVIAGVSEGQDVAVNLGPGQFSLFENGNNNQGQGSGGGQ